MAHKRQLQDVNPENNAADEKRHRSNLHSVVQEAVKANAIQKFWVVLEPMLRRVVSEEVERAIAKYLPSIKLGSRSPSKQLERSKPTSLCLQFQNKLALPLYTGCKIEGENGTSIRVSLQDATTGKVVVRDDESSIKLDIVVLEGDFPDDEEENWTHEDFENHVVKEREGKRPLLMGDLSMSLKKGTGTVGELMFTDNSSWIRSRKFRLGVRLPTGCLNGNRVREAKTEAFFVKDHRGQLYKKHYPPNLNDDVWRLEKIGKDGAYHKRLCEYHVNTVKDFLVFYSTGPSRLREIFGTTMSTKTWDCIIEHAKTCILNETQHVYYPDDTHAIGVILNTIYQPLGIVRNGTYMAASSLSDTEQVYMDRLVQEAYNDLRSLHKLPARANYQELEVFTRSGRTGQVFGGTTQIELSDRQHFQAQRNVQSFYESNCAAFATGVVPNMPRSDTGNSTIGLGIKQSLFTNAFSPGTLESLIACGNHGQKDVEPMGDDLALYQSHSRYGAMGDDLALYPPHSRYGDDCYNDGRTFGPWGNEDLFVLAGVSTGSFSSGSIPEGLKCTFPRLFGAQNRDVSHDSLHQRAYMGWRKLKLVVKCSYFIMKVIASRRQPQTEQLS